MDSIRDNDKWIEIYSNPRLSSLQALGLSTLNLDVIELEVKIEMTLNDIMAGIIDCIDEYRKGLYDKLYFTISFDEALDQICKEEVINRLRDLGYTVKVEVNTDEELEHLNILDELAEEDPSVGDILDEYYFSQDNYQIGWSI